MVFAKKFLRVADLSGGRKRPAITISRRLEIQISTAQGRLTDCRFFKAIKSNDGQAIFCRASKEPPKPKGEELLAKAVKQLKDRAYHNPN